jgi:hypothetical protein
MAKDSIFSTGATTPVAKTWIEPETLIHTQFVAARVARAASIAAVEIAHAWERKDKTAKIFLSPIRRSFAVPRQELTTLLHQTGSLPAWKILTFLAARTFRLRSRYWLGSLRCKEQPHGQARLKMEWVVIARSVVITERHFRVTSKINGVNFRSHQRQPSPRHRVDMAGIDESAEFGNCNV